MEYKGRDEKTGESYGEKEGVRKLGNIQEVNQDEKGEK